MDLSSFGLSAAEGCAGVGGVGVEKLKEGGPALGGSGNDVVVELAAGAALSAFG